MQSRIDKILWLVFLWIFLAGIARKYQEDFINNNLQNKYQANASYSEWRMQEGEYAVVYYRENVQEAQMVLDLADSYFPMIAKDFNWNRKEVVKYVLYDNREEMRKALHMKPSEQLPMGAYYHGVAAVLSPSLWTQGDEDWQKAEEFIENGPVVHEMIHFAMDETANGEYPHWFSEGVALYYEKKYTGFEWSADVREKSKAIAMEELYHKFDAIEPDLAYRKSYDWVNGFVGVYGEEALQELIKSGKMCLSPEG